ncbi:TetR family transcriptional regulator [Streptomyces sp. NPDC005438]|uniref:TetR/AcrR family transcriptional regulator n=1 Tax=Streptomyces sp. NPDC005438 TaxID=3156880 RepID=UPI0033BFB170
MAGLRERKKQQTRDALIRAAYELIATKGYEETTVDEISESVEISQRTFFRYFSSKEEVVFALTDVVESRYLEAVRDRPADEPPQQALLAALAEVWDQIGEELQAIVPLHVHMRVWQVVETTPTLLAAQMRRSVNQEEHLAGLIAQRTGVDPDVDIRPRVLVAAFCGVMQAASRCWATGDEITIASIREHVFRYMAHFSPDLHGDWHAKASTGS